MRIVTTKCPECQARLKIDPNAKQVTCEYCGLTAPVQVGGKQPPPKVKVVRVSRSARWSAGVIAAGVIISSVVLIGIIYFVARPTTTVVHVDPAEQCRAKNRDACLQVGVLLERSGDAKSAEQHYAKACKLGLPVGCFNQGVMATRRHDRKSAEPPLQRGCELGYATACTNLSVLLNDRGETKEALALARKACDAGNALGCNNVGSFLQTPTKRSAKDDVEACNMYKKACEMGSAIGCSSAGMCALERRQIDEAKKLVNRSLKQQPLPNAMINLGHAYLFSGDAELAMSYYKKALAAEAKTPTGSERAMRDNPLLDDIRNDLGRLSPLYPGQRRQVAKVSEQLPRLLR